MFRRLWSGLPADPVFPSDLKGLGYFVTDSGEIRSIEDPDYYFKYHLTKNERWNERQLFAFHGAVGKEIHARLAAEGFTTVPLPQGTPTTQPHVPILTSANITTASRVVVLFGETCQPLGVLAHRVISGRGGIVRGSVLRLAGALRSRQWCSAADPSPPGLVLANAGELWWWPEGGRGLTHIDRHRIPMASAVHCARYHVPEVNEVPGHKTVAEHVRSVFEDVVLGKGFVREDAKVDVIVVGDTAEEVEKYLDNDAVLERLGDRLNCLVVMGGTYSSKNFQSERFQQFVRERARAYIIHHSPLDTLVAGPSGNPGAAGFTSYGCPVFSAGGKALYTETLLIEAQSAVLSWMQDVALKGEVYKNEIVEILGDAEEEDVGWGPVTTSGAENTPENEVHGDAGRSQTEEKTSVTKDKTGTGLMVEVGTKVGTNKPASPPSSEGPDAADMKELAEEIVDCKISH